MESIEPAQFASVGNALPRPIVLQLIQSFPIETDHFLHRMHIGLAGADLNAVARATHDLRGFTSNFGAVAVTETTYRIERACSAGDVETAAGLVEQVQAECARAWTAISVAASSL